MTPAGIDHLVLTVASIDASVRFYEDVLGFQAVNFGEGRRAVIAGAQKINLHQAGEELSPHGLRPTPGSGDICILYEGELSDIADHLKRCNIEIELGPVERTGAAYPITSLYIRDPDQNLIELSVRQSD